MTMTPEMRKELLELYADLRVADVRDGMDWNMMHHYGSMSRDIRPLYRTHAVGIALTARYVPYQGTVPGMTPEEYSEWQGWYYQNICRYPWFHEIEEGSFPVIDESGVDVGLIGSHNGLGAYLKGARGFIIDGGVRDTDELILQKVPVWSTMSSQGMVQGRVQYESHNTPVNVGGVLVHSGDIIVADGDGVIVVPQKIAFEVAKWANIEHQRDKGERKKLYVESGRELDKTVL